MAGEAILGNIVTEILKKLGSFALEEINLARGVKKELEKLQKTILMIEAVISDAENKQVKEKSVGIWLKELRDLAYDADDILDEYAYDIMHRCQGLNRRRDQVRNFVKLSSNPIVLSSKMGHEIKNLNQKFDELARQRVGLGLEIIHASASSHNMGVDGSYRSRENYAFVDESKILGREVDKSKIIDMLLANQSSWNPNDKVLVIPIVGMGGLGKTTLAQLVYKDNVVEKHFDLKIWVCVSDVFNVEKLFVNIIESITQSKFDGGSNLNVIVEILQQHLRGKKFLLVLDDVWNEKDDEWNKLKDPLMVGAQGSRIIVTTRSENVASIVLTGEFSSYKLQTLGEFVCLSIFEQRAFGPSCRATKTQSLVEIGKELVRKCGGLPLAAKALGCLMRSKKEECEWLVIRDSKIWDNIPGNPNKILPVLKLSYDHLSSRLKQCFSYCSIFPKDSKIDRKTLIQLWVAEGFIQPSQGDNRLLEDIAHEYFNILLWDSLFQRVEWYYKMHDLIHDLAQSVAGTNECSVMGASEMRDIFEFRRLNLQSFNEELSDVALSEILKLSKNKLRTLFINEGRIKNITNYFFDNNKWLRVLDLSSTDIEELPPSIGKLKHLRYLDLSNTKINQLPDSITRLYNLQTLKLMNCRNLKKFPKDLNNKLINLRHLWHEDVSDWQHHVGQLTCLQDLNEFMVPVDNIMEGGSCVGGIGIGGIGELQCLDFLHGELKINGLERVKGRENAEKANLKAKQYIKELKLKWSYSNADVEMREDESSNHSLVLEGLQPHPNLRSLKIVNFMSPKFPTWMSNPLCLRSLVHLTLRNCNKCEQLPALGELPCLRVLQIHGMLLLEEWLMSSFPSLEMIIIKNCPKLKTMPTLFPSLTILYIAGGFKFLPQGLLKGNDLLESLYIEDCPDFQGFIEEEEEEGDADLLLSGSNSSLQELVLCNCPVLTLLPGDLRGLTSLRRLSIKDCGKLNVHHNDSVEMSDLPMEYLKFNNCNAAMVSSVLKSNMMDALPYLSIENIPGLMFLPQGLLKDCNVLQSVHIGDCPDFQGFIQEEEGDEDLLVSSSSSLQTLELCDCPLLTLLPGDLLRGLTSLEKLIVDGCGELDVDYGPTLKSMPTLFSCVKNLELSNCNGKIVGSLLRSNMMDTLTSFSLENISGLMFLPQSLLTHKNILEFLNIFSCPDFQGFIQEEEGDKDLLFSSSSCNDSLRVLQLYNCPVLRLLPDLRGLTSLHTINIQRCNEQLLVVLPEGMENRSSIL